MLEQNAIAGAIPAQVGASERKSALVDYSPQDKPWDTHRAQAQRVEGVYLGTQYDALAGRIRGCSGFLGFGWADDPETGESRLKLRNAQFCRVRHCPVCQWRRSLMWQARFYQALPSIIEQHPKARWLFLTLTVRNCAPGDVRATLRDMSAAWNRLRLRPEFRAVTGWIRTTEITRGRDGSAHPHFHALLMVKPSYFSHGYVTQARWVEIWQETARLDYVPVVDIRAIKGQGDALAGAVAETLKYAVKPEDMTADPEWLLEITKQVHKLRFVASGGALKHVLRESHETERDLLLAGEQESPEDAKPELYFDWHRSQKRYLKR